MPEEKSKAETKGNNSLIIGIIVGVVIIVGIILTIVLLNGGGYPKDMASYKKAVENRDAINCTITNEDEEGTVVMQADKGWDKIRMTVKDGDGEISMETLMIKDDASYMWTEGMAIKSTFSQDDFDDATDTSAMDEDNENNEGVIFECTNPSKADFTVPNKDWTDMSQYN